MRLLSAGLLAFAGACLCASGAFAQTAEATANAPPDTPAAAEAPETKIVEAAPTAAAACCMIPALTAVELEIMEPASSRTSQIGQKIRIRAAAPLTINGQIIVPEGTEGFAEVIQASKARMMGKGGELVLGLPFLELKGQRIPLKRMRYGPSNGKGNDTAAMAAVLAVGFAGMLVSGGNIDISQGARANAVVTTDTFITVQP